MLQRSRFETQVFRNYFVLYRGRLTRSLRQRPPNGGRCCFGDCDSRAAIGGASPALRVQIHQLPRPLLDDRAIEHSVDMQPG
jgi:hypothetical protein